MDTAMSVGYWKSAIPVNAELNAAYHSNDTLLWIDQNRVN